MRIVHLADLHLGFRQYQRLTPSGINQREVDVAETLLLAIRQIIELRPDAILIGGDVFHFVRPSNPAIVHAFRAFSMLREALPEAPIVMVAGNHDAPRTSDTGCILRLFREIGVHVADATSELFTFPSRDFAVLAVPDVPGIDRPPLLPPTGVRHTALLLHGEVAGVLPRGLIPSDRAAMEIQPGELNSSAWSYVALGHYHVYRNVAPNAYYSGSLDYTSSNPWGELAEQQERRIPGKGFIEHDLETGAHRFHPVKVSRRLIDLSALDATGLTAAEVDAAIRRCVEEHDAFSMNQDATRRQIDDCLVRLVIQNIPRHISRELDHAAVRAYRKRAMHFHLDMRRPVTAKQRSAGGAPGKRETLADIVNNRLNERKLESDIDRELFVSTGLAFLQRAEDAVSAAMPAIEG